MTANTQQQELLAAIGQRLREAREAQGVTLQEVASRTRIQNAFLERIEQGQLDGLPGFSFVRGFIRNYAQMLGIEDAELIEQLQAMGRVAEATPPPPMKPSTERLLDAEKTVGVPWPRLALLALLAILVLWVGYLIVRVFLPSDSAYEPSPTKALAQAPAPAAPIAPFASSAAAARPAGPGPTVATAPAGPAHAPAGSPSSVPVQLTKPGTATSALRVTLRGLEDTWVRYSVDHKPAMEVLMRPAESATLDADEEVSLTVGKSQGVSIYLNDEEMVLPAERNRLVEDLVLNKLSVVKIRN